MIVQSTEENIVILSDARLDYDIDFQMSSRQPINNFNIHHNLMKFTV